MKYNQNGIMEQTRNGVADTSHTKKVKVLEYKTKYKDYHKNIPRKDSGVKVLENQELPLTDEWLVPDDFDRIFMSTIKVWDYDLKSERWKTTNIKDARGVTGTVKKVRVSKMNPDELYEKDVPPRRKLSHYG